MAKTILKKAVKSQQQIEDLDLDFGDEEIEANEKTPPVIATKPKQFTRSITGKKEVTTDLFKLTVAKVIKYEGYDAENEHPDTHPMKFTTWEHTHPFRTYNKAGLKQTMSTPIGGHFHIVEWSEDKNGEEPTIISISGPMAMGKKKIRGRTVQVPVPVNDYDTHTHDIEYLRSCPVQFTAINIEAQNIIALDAQKTAPVPGVIG